MVDRDSSIVVPALARQSKKMSAFEVTFNVIAGYLISVLLQRLIFPWFGIDIPLRDNFLIGLFFTAFSLIRSYIVRRIFNLME